MTAGFLRKLWDRPAPLPPEVAGALADLERLAGERPALADHAGLLRELLPLLWKHPVTEQPPLLDRVAAAKLAGGIPLLRGETFPLDGTAFGMRWRDLCAALRRRQPDGAAPRLAEALGAGRLDAGEMLAGVLAGRTAELHGRFDGLGLDAGLAALVLRLALFPVLAQANAALAPLRQGVAWENGCCPSCGSWPLLGEFRGLEQTRFLRCGLCAAEWAFPRLGCPFCGTREHRLLGYFHVEGEEGKTRAATCAGCRGYVKMTATLAALSAPQLLVADLATLHLDLAAARRGYCTA